MPIPHHRLFQSLRFFFFFKDTATAEIYTLSLHDALPISVQPEAAGRQGQRGDQRRGGLKPSELSSARRLLDRKSTRLNSSHVEISYAVFCLKKKNTHTTSQDCTESSVDQERSLSRSCAIC